MNKQQTRHRMVIGRAEELAFVKYDIANIPAKVDTGAFRSAVHASDIVLSSDGKKLSFSLLGKHPLFGAMSTPMTARKFTQVNIANSFGQEELRYEINLRVKLGPKIVTSPFTLADRSKKVYPILIGRKLLNRRFVVDSAHTNVNRRDLKKKYSIIFPVDEEDGRED